MTMAFKIKDLIIHVLHPGKAGAHCGPATIEPAAAGAHCGPATIEPGAAAGVHCGPATIEPAAGGGHCGPATIEPQAALATFATLATLATLALGDPGAEDLATLKRLLQAALARVEAQEPGQAATLPQTLAEAEDLEERLKAALGELAEHKKTLG
jgi:hypothetical protein